MSKELRFGDISDPTVIEEDLIREEIRKYNKENKILNQDEIPFYELTNLSLSYKNILKLQNLEGLEKLEKLQLDNNTIAKIENLDHLVNLRWLDLSFNCITEMSGLDKLVNLEDLSLFSNLITQVTGIKTLNKLNVLSLGNNKLTDVGQLIHSLQWLENLEVLNVAGNDFIEQDYDNYIIALLKNLKYIDYVYIDEDKRKNFPRDGKYRLETTEEDGKESNKKKQEEEEREFARLNIQSLYKYDEKLLLDENGSEISDLHQLLELPEVYETSFSQYKETTRAKIEAFKNGIADQFREKEISVKNFKKAMKSLESAAEKDVAKLLAKYQRLKKHCDLDWEEEVPNWRENVRNILVYIDELDEKLMSRELDLLADLEAIREKHKNDIENIYGDIEQKKIASIIKDVEEIINNFFEAFKTETTREIAKRKPTEGEFEESNPDRSNTYDEDIRDEYGEMEQDGDIFHTLMIEDDFKVQISSFKENMDSKHKTAISDLRTKYSKQSKNYLDNIKKILNERNRKSVQNIMNFINDQKEYWNEKLSQ